MVRNTHDTIGKASQIFIERITNCIEKNIITLITRGEINLDQKIFEKVMTVIKLSVEEGHSLAYTSFMNVVKDAVPAQVVPLLMMKIPSRHK